MKEVELSAFFSPAGLDEPPSEVLLAGMLTLPYSDRTELAAVLGMMALEASRRS